MMPSDAGGGGLLGGASLVVTVATELVEGLTMWVRDGEGRVRLSLVGVVNGASEVV